MVKYFCYRKIFFLNIYIYLFLWGTVFAQNKEKAADLFGGGFSRNASLNLFAAIGQTAVVEASSNGNMTLSSGFVYSLEELDAPRLSTLELKPAPVNADERLKVSINAYSPSAIESPRLWYRQGGTLDFQAISMVLVSGEYQAFIPAHEMTAKGMEYFIQVLNKKGLQDREPESGFVSQQVNVAGEGVASANLLPAGTAQDAYRIISVPLALQNNSPAGVLQDDLGSYDKKKWRLFNEQGDEYPQSGDMLPGEAFWIIAKNGANIDTGPGTTVVTHQLFKIPLKAGWSLIGNPYNFAIPVTHIRFEKQAAVPQLRAFNGHWNALDIEPVTALQPFKGYAIYSAEHDFLMIQPDRSARALQTTTNPPQQDLWSINILAESQQAKDYDNIARVISGAQENLDRFDIPEPPVVGEYVSVYFLHQEWQATNNRYCSDARPESSEGTIWKVAVSSNIPDKIDLKFENIASVPAEFQIWLVDEDLNIAIDLRKNPHYQLAASSAKPVKYLLLAVGRRTFFSDKLSHVKILPTEYELSPNFPNPFNPTTTIRYGIPRSGKVSLKIYNMLGQKVLTLVDQQTRQEGYHIIVWDGRNRYGEKVASGIYLYSLQVDGFSQSRKMILLK